MLEQLCAWCVCSQFIFRLIGLSVFYETCSVYRHLRCQPAANLGDKRLAGKGGNGIQCTGGVSKSRASMSILKRFSFEVHVLCGAAARQVRRYRLMLPATVAAFSTVCSSSPPFMVQVVTLSWVYKYLVAYLDVAH